MYNTLGPAPGMIGSLPENSGMAGNYNPTGMVGGATQGPSWAQPQNIPGITGGVNNMVRALLGGMAQNRQAKQYADAIRAAQQVVPGQPMDINSQAQQQGMLTTPPPATNFDPNVPGGSW